MQSLNVVGVVGALALVLFSQLCLSPCVNSVLRLAPLDALSHLLGPPHEVKLYFCFVCNRDSLMPGKAGPGSRLDVGM